MNCNNCGSYVDPNSSVCTTCGTPTMATETKKKKAPIVPILIAIVLVFAIIAGGVAIGVTSNPHVKTLNAIKKTVFNSSELNFTVSVDYEDESEEVAKGSLVIGDDINSTSFKLEVEGDEVSLEDGKLYEYGEEVGKVEEGLKEAQEGLEDYLPEGTDLVEVVNGILNNKLDEKALEKAFDDVVVPTLQAVIEDEFDQTIEIPTYDEIFGTVTDIFKDKEAREAIGLEKVKSDLPGTTYEYNIDLGKLAAAAVEYIIEDKQYQETVAEITDSMDMEPEDIVDAVKAMFNDIDDITGTVTIKSGRITNVTVDFEDDATLVIEIESKK